ncbi:MAG: 6-phosphogluconolactonase, partial [Acidobacteria bacterium]|nr:6-phosphogluconolactonase [Acidobacteriota bacterium]
MWPRLTVAGDLDELARMGASLVREEAWRAVDVQGVFRVVLAGGETPRALYARLAEPPFRDVPWERTQVFWGDERHVGPSDTDSNYRMAVEALLSRVPVNPSNVFRIRGEKPDAELAAREYDATIRHVCALQAGEWPRFDLVLLGLGTDGHTASLFPGSPALQERSRLV